MMKSFLKGVRQSIPIMLGYIQIAIAYASLARTSGLNLQSRSHL